MQIQTPYQLMKRFPLALCILLFCPVISFTQTIDELEKEAVIKHKIKSKVQWDHKYEGNKPAKSGKKSSQTTYSPKGDILRIDLFGPKNLVSSRETYEYDSRGNRTLYLKTTSPNDPNAQPKYKKSSTYNSIQKVTLETGFDGAENFKNTFSYNDKGRPTKITYTLSGRIDETREYAHQGNTATVKILKSGQHLISTMKLSYDAKNNITEEIILSLDGRELERKKYTYRDDGKLMKEVKLKLGNPYYTITYTYNAQGRLTKITEDSKAKGKFIKKEYAYDSKGNLTEFKWRRKPSDEFNKKTYSYNDKGICTSVHTIYPATKYQLLTKYTYEFY